MRCFKRSNSILLQKEVSWRKKSRLKWAKEGDTNSAYVHWVATSRMQKTIIKGFELEDGGIVRNQSTIASKMTNF